MVLPFFFLPSRLSPPQPYSPPAFFRPPTVVESATGSESAWRGTMPVQIDKFPPPTVLTPGLFFSHVGRSGVSEYARAGEYPLCPGDISRP